MDSPFGKLVARAAAITAPVARKVGKATIDAVATVGVFAFETTRDATRKMSGPVYGPPCPKCGEQTVIRLNRKTHQPFAACSAWRTTGCNFTAAVTFADD
jgi:predicted RNA-binding Zn-ribbon protein involved in translation (DUF1610 family)